MNYDLNKANMNKLQKDAIYGKMCKLISEYESLNQESWQRLVVRELAYDLLVEILNNWDELTSEE